MLHVVEISSEELVKAPVNEGKLEDLSQKLENLADTLLMSF